MRSVQLEEQKQTLLILEKQRPCCIVTCEDVTISMRVNRNNYFCNTGKRGCHLYEDEDEEAKNHPLVLLLSEESDDFSSKGLKI